MSQNSPIQSAESTSRSATPSYKTARSEANSRASSISHAAPSARSINVFQALALTPLDAASATSSLPSVFTESRATTPGQDTTPSALSDSENEPEYETMDDGSIQIRRRSSARHNSTTRRASQRSLGSPLTRLRGLSAIEPVDDEAIEEEEDEKAEHGEAEDPREETEQSQFGEMITELSRHVSVEAAAGPVALYAPRSRTASVSTVRSGRARRPSNRRPSASRVTFPDTVVEHDLARRSAKPDLPRIDSEKTLAPDVSDDEAPTTLAKTKSRESRSARGSEDAKFSDSEDAEAQARAEEDAAITAVVKTMSRTRKLLLGTSMMLTVLISVSRVVGAS